MACMIPSEIPPTRDHLEPEEREALVRFELLVDDRRFEDAQEVVEDLWREAIDAHRQLYHGLANALTAVCARDLRQRRGAMEIARRSRELLAAFPRVVVGIELDALLDSVDDVVLRGDGPVLLRRQG
jgi:predicted metal-dependent hydrolase